MATTTLGADSARVIPFPYVATDRYARRILRGSLRAAINELHDLLDALDGDADSEDCDPGGGNVEDEGEGIDEREPEGL